ncbi:MAG: biotin--[acetyl-CoA-carboxylase] ligase [Bdellovibrio sp.]|jgi:BirA family biotin operon repressor/biotin-[acetyl-CoA-carboxylase] ligase
MFSIYETTKDWASRSGFSVIAEPTMPSTNDLAKERAIAEPEPLAVILTDHQSQGRGRGTKTWSTKDSGQSLLSTWSFMLKEPAQPIFSPAIGLALFRAANTTWLGLPWSLKAPNDLYLGDKKVAGILLEGVQEGHRQRLLIGLGMNVFGHPDVANSGALIDFVTEQEIDPEIWRQFLDRVLLEVTATLMVTRTVLQPGQRRGLHAALNQFPATFNAYKDVQVDGSLVKQDGTVISWSSL